MLYHCLMNSLTLDFLEQITHCWFAILSLACNPGGSSTNLWLEVLGWDLIPELYAAESSVSFTVDGSTDSHWPVSWPQRMVLQSSKKENFERWETRASLMHWQTSELKLGEKLVETQEKQETQKKLLLPLLWVLAVRRLLPLWKVVETGILQ